MPNRVNHYRIEDYDPHSKWFWSDQFPADPRSLPRAIVILCWKGWRLWPAQGKRLVAGLHSASLQSLKP
ncbi:hypothetical protein OPV22_033404 [Ensete ventricosum]|uniref:Uncharacterized protein n=1 Tax=Ensete ventricosum TaxID=4639 RepID=A0AAV8PU66_ENSVE|nr:hypothetical protein OPV22_033404 [Ensete ventricosum]